MEGHEAFPQADSVWRDRRIATLEHQLDVEQRKVAWFLAGYSGIGKQYKEMKVQLAEAQGKLAILTDATMQHLGGERLDKTCDCPLGGVLDELPKSAWDIWEQRQRARILKGE